MKIYWLPDLLTMIDDETLLTQLTFISIKFRELTEGITNIQGRLSLTESVSMLLGKKYSCHAALQGKTGKHAEEKPRSAKTY